MSEATEITSGDKEAAASGETNQEQQEKQDKVSYETYRKTVAAEKKAKAEREELARKLKAYEDEKLQAQGKSQELVESLRKQVAEKEERLSTVVHGYARKAITSKMREEALKQGCVDVDLFLKAGVSEFSKIEVDPENDFSVNDSDLKAVFEEMSKKHPMLFKKQAPKINDATPASKVTETDYDKMSLKDVAAAYAKLGKL